MRAGDALAVVRAYGCNLDRGRRAEWIRDCAGLIMAELVAILHIAMRRQEAIREPSGFREQRALWEADPSDIKRESIAEIMAELGIEVGS